MKSIAFRPLRRLSNGKVAVASYMQWNKVRVADYRKFQLVVRDEYKAMDPEEQVHNHKGEPLFFIAIEPDEHTAFPYPTGVDCDGTPCFSHYTANRIAENFTDVDQFEPLTVGIVTKWFGWFLYRLDRVSIS